jgi:hypothetical protein
VWGVLIGLGIAMALQPLPVLAVAFLLSVANGVRKATAFFLGEFLVLLAICVATVALHLGTSREQASRPASFVTLVVGVALIGAGLWWAGRARRSESTSVPGWMAKIDRMEPWPAFLLGLFLPTYVIAVAAGAHIVGTHPGAAEAAAGMLVFLLLGTSTIFTPILLARLAPERSAAPRARLRDWLAANWRAVGAVLLLAVGAALVVKAVIALT